MRIAPIVMLSVTLLWIPLSASASPMECQRLNHQIGHFEAMMSRADQLENDMWQGRFDAHLADLKSRRAATCPGYAPGEQAAKQFQELVKLGAQAALTYFTMGAM